MRLGFFTAALPQMSLSEIATWAEHSGFGALEIACWPAGGVERRYGGVSHIDVVNLDTAQARAIRREIDDRGLVISSLGYYPNPLDPDPTVRAAAAAHIRVVIDAAVLLEVEIVGTFVGADQRKSAAENLEDFAQVWPPLVQYAKERGVKIAIENCPMLWKQN